MKNELSPPMRIRMSLNSNEITRLWLSDPDEGSIFISLRLLDLEIETYAQLTLEIARQIARIYARDRKLDEVAVHERILAGLTAELSEPSGGQPEGHFTK